MATAESVRGKISGLIDQANAATGRRDATLTEAVGALVVGYGSGEGTAPSVEQATPTISVSTDGLITASATQEAGRVAAGTKTATRQLSTVSGKTVTPGTSEQTAVAASRYTTAAIKVAGDSNLISGNIKYGVSIFGVEGIYRSDGTVEAADLAGLHIWDKYVSGADRIAEEAVTEVILSYSSKLGTGNPLDAVDYSDAISLVDGRLVLSDPVTTINLNADTRSQILGKYIYAHNDSRYYRIPADAIIIYRTSTYTDYVEADKAFRLSAEEGGAYSGVVASGNANAYPNSGEQDGYHYTYLGTLASLGGGEGVILPNLTNPGGAADLARGKQLINGSGAIVTGSLFEVNSGNSLYANNNPALSWRDDGKIETVGTYGVAGSGDGGIVRPGAKFAIRTPAEQYGDATAADVVAGKTFTSAAGLEVVGTGTGAGGSGLVMKTGMTTSNVIDTGLSVIRAIVLYKASLAGTGLIQLIADLQNASTYYSYCSSSSDYIKNAVVAEGSALVAVEGGTITWNGSSTAALTPDTEYNWIAVGTA